VCLGLGTPRRPGGTRRRPAALDGVPPSLQIPPHVRILTARSPAPYSPTTARRAHSPTAFFDAAPASFPYACSSLPSPDRSAGQRSPPSHSTYSRALCARLRVLAMYVYVGIVECAPASHCTLLAHTQVSRRAHTYRSYSSSSDIFGAWFGFGFGFGMVHTSPRHHPLTHYPLPPPRSWWWSDYSTQASAGRILQHMSSTILLPPPRTAL
jgi:hypothetical protein